MKYFIKFSLLWITLFCNSVNDIETNHLNIKSTRLTGRILDENGNPIEFVNIQIKDTIEGTTSSYDGSFCLETQNNKPFYLVVSFIGYEDSIILIDDETNCNLQIVLYPVSHELKEVSVYANNRASKSLSTLENINNIELVTTAGSEGDLYKAISLLPSVQSNADGRLIVRGGSSKETQTYIDGMHVLSPYTTNIANIGSRGRYSPFLFEGINFSTGGYSPEYSQSLSAILALNTKDESKYSKLGIDIMNISLGGGGTKAWKKGSTSFNVVYTDLGRYNTFFDTKAKNDWDKPYKQYSLQNQWRFELNDHTYIKFYTTYDKTKFIFNQKENFLSSTRGIDYEEDNLYINSTWNRKNKNGLNLFSGIAYSLNKKEIQNANIQSDHFNSSEQEIHIKSKIDKWLNNWYYMEIGIDGLLKKYNLIYQIKETTEQTTQPNIYGGYFSNNFIIKKWLSLNLSSRFEYTSLNNSYNLLPRLAINATVKNWNFTGIIGMYQQSSSNDYLIYNKQLPNEKNRQVLFGAYYQNKNYIIRIELYDKHYEKLSTKRENKIFDDGKGYSRGIDLYINNRSFLKHWDYSIGYSYNNTKRNQDNYIEQIRPSFISKHNLSLTLKYTNYTLRSIIGLTNELASGRYYHNPNKVGNMNSKTPIYNSLDVSYTFLAHKKLIIYASASNILNRKNIFGYTYNTIVNNWGQYDSAPIQKQQNQTFYIGLFFTIGKNVAYDASNF